ncbi:MAG: sigma-70 family RNA polymerase sigma factor [Acidobacteria bacterium]|nr:sigma-70 family RNA polymerase sigma factor [Acidobacteriota bacterium]
MMRLVTTASTASTAPRRPPADVAGGGTGRAGHRTRAIERALVRQAQEGDPEAFAQLVQRRTPGVVAFLRRMLGDAEDARDVAQITFLRVWENIGRYDPAWAFSTWLFRIAGNLAIDALRAKKTRQRTGAGELPPREGRGRWPRPTALGALHRKDVPAVFEACAGVLSEKQRRSSSCGSSRRRKRKEIAAILELPGVHRAQPPLPGAPDPARRDPQALSRVRRRRAMRAVVCLAPFPRRRRPSFPFEELSSAGGPLLSLLLSADLNAHLAACAGCRADAIERGPDARLRAPRGVRRRSPRPRRAPRSPAPTSPTSSPPVLEVDRPRRLTRSGADGARRVLVAHAPRRAGGRARRAHRRSGGSRPLGARPPRRAGGHGSRPPPSPAGPTLPCRPTHPRVPSSRACAARTRASTSSPRPPPGSRPSCSSRTRTRTSDVTERRPPPPRPPRPFSPRPPSSRSSPRRPRARRPPWSCASSRSSTARPTRRSSSCARSSRTRAP